MSIHPVNPNGLSQLIHILPDRNIVLIILPDRNIVLIGAPRFHHFSKEGTQSYPDLANRPRGHPDLAKHQLINKTEIAQIRP